MQIQAAAPAAPDRQRYSTSVVKPAERLDFWNDVASQVYGPVAVTSHAPGWFDGEIVRLQLGGCELTTAGSTPARLQTGRAKLPPWHEGGTLTLMLQRYGHSHASHAGNQSEFRPGDFCLMDSADAYEISFDEPVQAIAVLLPCNRLGDRAPKFAPHMGKLMPGHRGGSAILSSFLLSAWSDLESGFQESWSDILSDTIWNLVDLAFLPTERTDAASLRRRQKRQEAQRFVEHELFEPGLGVTAIAQALHVSERYVQTLFAEIATTPSKYILERRLDLAAERLRRESQAAITEIALAVGFSDISYFCHCFRRRFGVSARSYRLSHRA